MATKWHVPFLLYLPSFRLIAASFECWKGWKKAWIMIVCARGARCNRVCTEARSHAGLGSPRVSRARFVDKPTIHALHGGAEQRGVGLRFQNMGAVQLVNWFSKIWVVVLFCSSYKPGERHPPLPVFSCRCKKKLIVSRQPIFTNLKSNTMKNSAKVHEILKTCKP